MLPLSGCAGVLQSSAPAEPARYERVRTGSALRVGAAAADITPADPQYLAGFDPARVSTGVHTPLEARALVIELGGERLAIVGVDNLGLQRGDADWIKTGLAGFEVGSVFLCSTHTHAAPDLVGFWGPYLLASGRDRDYLARVRAAVARAVHEASARAVPATLWLGESRLPPSGLVRNSNRDGVFDPRVTVLQARERESGAPVAALLHFACHPEVLRRRNTLVSSDFVGDLCREWEDAGQGRAVFVNGALGAMVTPGPDGIEGMPAMVQGLLETCLAALDDAEELPVREIEIRRRDVFMPLTSLGLLLGRLTLAIPRQAYGDMLRTTVGYLRLGSFEAACVPGEMEPVLAARLRHVTHRPGLRVFGLVDDEIGYLLREVDARDPEFAYERSMSPLMDAGERIVAALVGGGVIPAPATARAGR